MTNHGVSPSPDSRCVFVETNFSTRLGLLVRNDENISDFKEKLCEEHKKTFPEFGEINISALKVKRRGQLFHLTDGMDMIGKAFEGMRRNWFVYVDVVRVDKGELLAIMDVHQPEIDSAKDLLTLEGVKTKSKKRKMVMSDEKISRKKSKSSVVAMTVSKHATESCEGIGKDIESSEKNDISMEKNKQTSEMDQEKIPTVNSELVKEGEANETPKEDIETDLATEEVPIEKLDEQDNERGEEGSRLTPSDGKDLQNGQHMDNQLEAKSDLTTGPSTEKKKKRKKSTKDQTDQSTETLVNPLVEAIEKEHESVEKSLKEGRDEMETDNLENATNSGLTTSPVTEKKKRRTKISKDDITLTVNEINGLAENVDSVDATPQSVQISTIQKEHEIVEKSLKEGRNEIETVNVANDVENATDSGLATTPITEKKKRRKKSSKDDITQTVNEINVEVAGNVDVVDATPQSSQIETVNVANDVENATDGGLTTSPVTEKKKRRKKSSKDDITQAVNEINGGVAGNLDNPLLDASQKENEIGEKMDEDVVNGKAIPTDADNIQNKNSVSDMDNQLTDGQATEKKRKRKKSSKEKDQTKQSIADTTTSREILSEREKVPENIDGADVTSESLLHSKDAIQTEMEMGPVDSLQVDDPASTSVQDSKAVDDNRTGEHEVAKDKSEKDATEAKPVKSAKKKKSKQAKTSAKEDTVAEPDGVIRTVLDSLQQKGKTEENQGITVKKTSKKSKKKDSLNIVAAQTLSVEEVPLISNPKDTDASLIPAKQDTKKSIEPADTGDNFDSSQKETTTTIVGGGTKSKKEKKSSHELKLSGGSVDGSLSSMKPKERKGKVQPAVVKKKSNSVTSNKSKMNWDVELGDSGDDDVSSKAAASDVSTKSPSDSSSEGDSDVTSMSRKQVGNILATGNLEDILKSSRSFKMAKLRASQSEPGDDDDDSPPLDCVPDSQAN